MAVKRHKFLVSEGEIYQILFADDSDDETALQLDGEDLEFFGEDVDNVEAETDIEHPDKPGPSNPPSKCVRHTASHNNYSTHQLYRVWLKPQRKSRERSPTEPRDSQMTLEWSTG